MDLWQSLGDLHPKLVHFPLVLLLAGLLFDLAGIVFKSDKAHWAAKPLTAAGTVILLFTFISGIYAEVWAGRALVPHHMIELHELAANIASWGFVILAAWRLLLNVNRRRAASAYVIIGLAWYGLMIITAHLGGKLITDYGAAVSGARALTAPSLHDLNTLATRQTDLNLRYSEMMHHIFGYITLALAGSLLAQALFPRSAGKLKWVGPTLLLLGGIFLFFFADLDLYRLTDLRQWRDREVQLHKTIAIILTVVGGIGLRAMLKKPPATMPYEDGRSRMEDENGAAASASSSTLHSPSSSASPWAGAQATLIAIMSLIGGGMLFTHVHTVAPYTNVAAGVYIAHVVMGCVALAIGASRLLADAYPSYRRVFATTFALFMLAESILLLTYNEGLPWYIGYGSYNRWGKHGGTIAPYGKIRAELTFDNDTQTLDVHVLDRFKDDPVPIKHGSNLNLLISRGYEETAIPLMRGSTDSHFTAEAPFLKDVPAFSARLALPIGNGKMRMGYFDPWVTPLIDPVPPNEVARFGCPMHEGVRASEPEDCKLCDMPLVALDTKPRTGLRDDNYNMLLSAPAKQPGSRSVTITLTPQRDGAALHAKDLATVHEYTLHLIIVSQDLTFFDHVHPTPQPDGTFTLGYTFPADAQYILFADITPRNDRSQVFRLPLEIGAHHDTAPNRLIASPARSKPLASDPAITASLDPTPRQLTSHNHAQLLFTLADNSKPITDLAPYIGAMGHCVVISEDTQTYLHCHPDQLLNPTPDARGGPSIPFHLRFPAPGRYKIWGQFKRARAGAADKTLIADFVVDVKSPLLPSSLTRMLFDD